MVPRDFTALKQVGKILPAGHWAWNDLATLRWGDFANNSLNIPPGRQVT